MMMLLDTILDYPQFRLVTVYLTVIPVDTKWPPLNHINTRSDRMCVCVVMAMVYNAIVIRGCELFPRLVEQLCVNVVL